MRNTTATTTATTEVEATTPEVAPEATTAPVTTPSPITASISAGQKYPSLDLPADWTGSRSIAVNNPGTAYAFLSNDGRVYQGLIAEISPRAIAFGYAFGSKQKSDSDGAKDKGKTTETAHRISGTVHLIDWNAPRASGPREETATPLDLQIKAQLLARLKTGKMGTTIKANKIKLTGFTGSANHLFDRYAEVVKAATGMEATEAQWTGFIALVTGEAESAIAAISADPFA